MSQLVLKPAAVAIFVVLMGEHRDVATDELAALLGVKKVNSEALKQLRQTKLVEVGKVGRRSTYRLGSYGWKRSVEVMGIQVSAKGSTAHALSALLHALHRGFSERPTLSPEDFFRAKNGTPEPMTASDTEGLIRKAYAQLAHRVGDWVPLADLRENLSQVTRDDADAALRSLAIKEGIHLAPWDNRKALTKRDHAAAIRWGGSDNHVLRIEIV
jgi:hypothetical protein